MSGLIMKDLYNFKQYSKQYLLMLAFFCVFAFGMKSPTYIVFMGVMMGMTYTFSSLSLDEAGGYAFSLMLPASRKQIVGAKYLMLIFEMLAVVVLSVILGSIIAGLNSISYLEWVPSLMGAVGFFMVMMSVAVPVSIKWKVEKARILFMGMVLIPAIGIYIFAKVAGDGKLNALLAKASSQSFMVTVFGAFIAIAIVCLVVSYFISVHIFEKREF